MGLQITDGTTTITIGPSGAMALKHFTPTPPEIDAEQVGQAGVDGGEQPIVTYRNITETIEVLLEGTLAEQGADIRSLNGLFQQARYRQRTGMGAAVYVWYRVADTDAWYRSEILAGRVIVDEGDLEYDTQLASAAIEAAIIITRRFFWEYAASSAGATAALEVPLNTTSGGVAITNDAGNTLDVDGDDVAGDLPAPLQLAYTNTDANVNRVDSVYIAQNVFSEPADFSHHFAAGVSAAVGATETLLYTFNLTSAMLEDLGGNICRLLMLMSAMWPNTLWLRFAVYWSVTRLWEGPWVQKTGIGLKDMGAVRLPPRVVTGGGAPEAMELRLYGRDATNIGITYALTWLQILPIDGFRHLDAVGYGLAQNTRVVDDGIAGEIWSDGWAGGGYTPHYIGYGQPISVWPGRDQRLYVTVDTQAGTGADARTGSVRAYYRPRRLLL